jgi:hypothetical protein
MSLRRRSLGALVIVAALADPVAARAQASAHDFDFEIGSWTVANSRLMHHKDGTSEWIHFAGTSDARPVWDGRGDVVELESDAPYGHSTGLIVRLLDPSRHQWRFSFASAADGEIGRPFTGAFHDGRGEFTSADEIDGRPVLVRHVLSSITPTSYRLEQAVSRDGGRSWEVDWISEHTRAPGGRARPGER